MSGKRKSVYVSHAHADAAVVPRVLERLRAMGLLGTDDEVYVASDLGSGHASLRDGVRRQIQSASTVVILWSQSSARSQWVNYEIGLADAFGKRIIPVVLSGDAASLPMPIQQWQAVVMEPGDA